MDSGVAVVGAARWIATLAPGAQALDVDAAGGVRSNSTWEVQDDRPLRGRAPGLEHGLADLERELGLGAGEALGLLETPRCRRARASSLATARRAPRGRSSATAQRHAALQVRRMRCRGRVLAAQRLAVRGSAARAPGSAPGVPPSGTTVADGASGVESTCEATGSRLLRGRRRRAAHPENSSFAVRTHPQRASAVVAVAQVACCNHARLRHESEGHMRRQNSARATLRPGRRC